MKKRFIAILMCTFVLGLTACSGTGTPNTEGTKTETNTKIETENETVNSEITNNSRHFSQKFENRPL